MTHKVVCQKLNEHEIGRGGDQLIGYVLSLNMNSRNAFVHNLDAEPERIKKAKSLRFLPDGYRHYVPFSDPYSCEVEDDVYLNLVKHAQEDGIIVKVFPEKI